MIELASDADVSLEQAQSSCGFGPYEVGDAFKSDRIAVAESGLFHPADLARMARSGARCFLIGESLMRADDVAAATATILAKPVGATVRAG